MKILAVRLGSMGDVIHTLPAVALLKHGFPRAEVTWAIESRWAPLLEGNPCVDCVLPLSISKWRKNLLGGETRSEFRRARRQLREARFDLAVDFQGLIKSAVVTFFSRADRVLGFDRRELREPLAATFYSNRVYTGAGHVVEKCLRLASAAGAHMADARDAAPVFSLPQGTPEPLLPVGDFVLTSPAAGWMSKQWPAEHYVALAERIWRESQMPLVVDCAPGEMEAARSIVNRAQPGSCLLHPSSLAGLIAATRRARAVIGVDSGPLHLAAALRKPGVALFGPTDPARNGPFGGSLKVLRRPDALTSYKRDAQIHPAMKSIQPEEVWQVLRPMLLDTRAPVSR
jgi:heptosyltransferase-1